MKPTTDRTGPAKAKQAASPTAMTALDTIPEAPGPPRKPGLQ